MAEHAVAGRAGAAGAAGRVEVADAAAMRALGERLARILRPGDLVVLSGPLGAGKTTLVQGIGAGLRVRGPVTSPTFVIARVHRPAGDGPALVHADAYRLGSWAEVDDLDLDADMARSVTVIEWGEGLVEGLAPDHLLITIDRPGARPIARPGARPIARPAARPAAGTGGEPGAEPGGEAAGEPGGEPRVVALEGHGERWENPAELWSVTHPGGSRH